MPKIASANPAKHKQPSFAIAILAAGKGTRLKSRHPKVLHEIAGKPLLAHVVAAAMQVVPPQNIFAIIGHEAEKVRAELTAAIDEDVVAFNAVMGAYGLPRGTDEEKAARAAAIQAALKQATDAPLRAVKACHEVIKLSAVVAEKGNLNVISDAGVAVLAANAGLRSAALNVYINAKSIKDREFAEIRLGEVNALTDLAALKTEEVYAVVRGKIGS